MLKLPKYLVISVFIVIFEMGKQKELMKRRMNTVNIQMLIEC